MISAVDTRGPEGAAIIVFTPRPPEPGETLWVHDAADECPRCGTRCIDVHAPAYDQASENRFRFCLILSVGGAFVFGSLTALTTPAVQWPILIPLAALGWTTAVFSGMRGVRDVIPGFWPRGRRQWRRFARALGAQIGQLALVAAPPYAAVLFLLNS
ncbi:hypothetical protein [Microbacterium sp. cf332]|uniref:hypothetical protein n=1 Tax=Microbacterium sp. cf332 TaxID=1761804 RepID=UPI00087F7956|nr:hypothetical protein [Microbacterium sp. cf332]SDQ07768.1 hypothetical protein SAMN04487847_0218 [Microbacterium sp. cf332]